MATVTKINQNQEDLIRKAQDGLNKATRMAQGYSAQLAVLLTAATGEKDFIGYEIKPGEVILKFPEPLPEAVGLMKAAADPIEEVN